LHSCFVHDASGTTAIEHGLIVALIAVVIIAAVTLVGSNLNGNFNTISRSL
jgi:pilus assembly protein Flp/PilA